MIYLLSIKSKRHKYYIICEFKSDKGLTYFFGFTKKKCLHEKIWLDQIGDIKIRNLSSIFKEFWFIIINLCLFQHIMRATSISTVLLIEKYILGL